MSIEDVWGFVSGLQLGNLKAWDCPGGETRRTLPLAAHLKQRVCGGKGWAARVHQARSCRREEERLP